MLQAPPISKVSLGLKIFTVLSGLGFASAAAGYYLLFLLKPSHQIFAVLPRMFAYHEQHPFEYILIATLTYAVIATLCAVRFPRVSGWERPALILGVILASIILASIPGGILWHIHDMQAGFVPNAPLFWQKIVRGAADGVSVGWLIIALSFPYNLLGFAVAYWLTLYAFKLALSLDLSASISKTPSL